MADRGVARRISLSVMGPQPLGAVCLDAVSLFSLRCVVCRRDDFRRYGVVRFRVAGDDRCSGRLVDRRRVDVSRDAVPDDYDCHPRDGVAHLQQP